MDHSGSMATVHPTKLLEILKKTKKQHTPQMKILFDELEELEFKVFYFIIPVLLYREVLALEPDEGFELDIQ